MKKKNFNQVEGKADGVSYLLASGFPLISGRDLYATAWAPPPTKPPQNLKEEDPPLLSV